MKFAGKEISLLDNNELWEAIQSVAIIDANRVDKLSQSRKRHKTLFENHPPVENPEFTNLVNELQLEFKNRKLK